MVYAERVTNLITDGALRLPANPAEGRDPATGQYVAAFTGFENEPGTFIGVGAEVGGKWSPTDGVDLSVNYSYEKLIGCLPTQVPGFAVTTEPLTSDPCTLGVAVFCGGPTTTGCC